MYKVADDGGLKPPKPAPGYATVFYHVSDIRAERRQVERLSYLNSAVLHVSKHPQLYYQGSHNHCQAASLEKAQCFVINCAQLKKKISLIKYHKLGNFCIEIFCEKVFVLKNFHSNNRLHSFKYIYYMQQEIFRVFKFCTRHGLRKYFTMKIPRFTVY